MAKSMPDLRPVFFVIGLMTAALGVMMFAPMLADFFDEGRSWRGFGVAGLFTTIFGAVMATATYTPKPDLRARGAFVLTVFAWIILSVMASIPFMLEPVKLTFTDALFEATSGITTRIGGIGIIVTAMAILPMLKVGGMQLFRLESSDVGEKILPKAAGLAAGISGIYLVLTVLCMAGYMLTGMDGFDAVAHAMTTVATGGYSTSDASMGGFADNGADIVCIAFMMAGAMPFGMYLIMATRGDFRAPFKDSQVKAFIVVMTALIVLVSVSLYLSGEMPFMRGLRLAAFNSTACSLKIFRYQVAFEAMRAYLFKMPRRNAVSPLRYAGKPLPDSVVYSVMSYFFVLARARRYYRASGDVSGLTRRSQMGVANGDDYWTA